MSNRQKLRKDNFIQKMRTANDKFIITHAQDVDPYLKAAHAQRMGNFHTDDGFSKSGNMRKVASIPDVLYTQLIKEDPELEHNPNKLIRKIKELKAQGLDFTVVDTI